MTRNDSVTPEECPWSAGSATALLPEALCERYHAGRLIASGASSTVLEAIELAAGRRVAIKLMKPSGDPMVRERFRRDLAILSALRHPHLPRALEVDLDGPQPCAVMEYVQGGSLRHRLRREGRFAAEEAARIVLDCLWALEAAHDRGVVHGRLTPDDILFAADGTVRLVGFGSGAGLAMSGLPGSDTYALGLVLYEMLCGQPAYEPGREPGPFEIAPIASPVPLLRRASAVPRSLAALVHRVLAMRPFDGALTAGHFAQLLRAWLGLETSNPPSRPGANPVPAPARSFVMVFVLATALVAASAIAWTRAGSSLAARAERHREAPQVLASRSLAMVTYRTALLLPPSALGHRLLDGPRTAE